MQKNDILEFLYGLQMFGVKLGLDNICTLLQSVDNPQDKCEIVHVAGTNGKGSVCAFLREILMQAGFRVGTYTSPHLHSFNERITINNQPISDTDLVDLVDELRQLNPHLPATFFEFTTALALLYFAREGVDFVLLEVGMGGRLDATNVVVPTVAVITPISYDHADYLGSSLAEIAAEKGGIIKEQVPVVIAPQPESAQQVLLDIAAQRNAVTWCYGRDFSCCRHADRSVDPAGGLDVVTPGKRWSGLQPGLLGSHQDINLSVALMALQCLNTAAHPLTSTLVQQAVAQTVWPGRLEWWMATEPPVLLDGAHNVAGAAALAEYLRSNSYGKIRWVGGFKVDKDVAAILAELLPYTSKFYAVEPPVEQPYPLDDLVAGVAAFGVELQSYSAVAVACKSAQQECLADEIVVVAGSLFLVAACREYLITLGN